MCLLSADRAKAEKAEALLASGGVVSVQVLNEFAAVASRKLHLSWPEVGEILGTVRRVCRVVPVTAETHDRAVMVADRYGIGFYDALIVASALLEKAETLYTEDLQNGQVIDRRLTIRNPFVV